MEFLTKESRNFTTGKARWVPILGLALLFLVACARVSDTPTPAATATPVPTPTLTPTPTVLTELKARQVKLPADEGAHGTPFEWWYFNGHLTDETGSEYSYHFVTFEITTPEGLTPRLLQLGWSDHGADLYLTEELPSFSPGISGSGSFDIQMDGWRMRGDGSRYNLSFGTGNYALELEAAPTKPAVLHQGTGLVDLGRAGESYYYTRSRLATSGFLTVGEERLAVTGSSWMDHQWGDFGTASPVGWDWVSLQLDDGSELMVTLVWDADDHEPILTYGTYVAADATTTQLTDSQITLTSTGAWTSPNNGTEYPMGWELEVTGPQLSLRLDPVQEEAEFAGSSYIPVPYWEGAVAVAGSSGDRSITGKGFVELVGYADRVEENLPLPAPGQ
ncbi:MAG: lipocalin family protein [Dehalococcoidia bacterium]